LSQLIKNKIPITNAGPEIIIDQYRAIYSGWFKSVMIKYSIPARIKAIPPTNSYFQDINKTTSKISTGILCINKPTIVCQKFNFKSKMSDENKAKKQRNISDNILGVQYINLLIFFPIISIQIIKVQRTGFEPAKH
jgi:hypothetical protein